MNKTLLTAFLFSLTVQGFSQKDFLVLKKKNRPIEYFWTNSYIAFQLKNEQWVKGIITKIDSDSFYLKVEIIRQSLTRSDTVHFSGYHYAISDIYAMPKRGVLIDYKNDRFQISTSGGHQHWYWVKSGWIFRAVPIGYTALNVANGIIKNDFTFSGSRFGIAAAVFLGGMILHRVYKVTFRIGKKYHIESSSMPVK
ncbi:MAG: hypothetical protein ABIN67_23325 [Ferruginibacter sp.]